MNVTKHANVKDYIVLSSFVWYSKIISVIINAFLPVEKEMPIPFNNLISISKQQNHADNLIYILYFT